MQAQSVKSGEGGASLSLWVMCLQRDVHQRRKTRRRDQRGARAAGTLGSKRSSEILAMHHRLCASAEKPISTRTFLPRSASRAQTNNDPRSPRRPPRAGLASTMSSSERIGAPFTLATLSKPVGATGGRMHAASVCSLSGIKKRKRTEIAVGLDGEGVSIYSVCAADTICDPVH
jgi:hypothetical protein